VRDITRSGDGSKSLDAARKKPIRVRAAQPDRLVTILGIKRYGVVVVNGVVAVGVGSGSGLAWFCKSLRLRMNGLLPPAGSMISPTFGANF